MHFALLGYVSGILIFKRFRRTGNGGFKCGQSHRRHILTKKSTKRKRQLRSPATIHPSDVRMAARMMPYS